MTTTPPPAEPLAITVSGDLAQGTCEPVSGDLINRDGLRGALVSFEPRRTVTAFVDATGALVYYRDQVVGAGGYTVQLDMAADSAFVLDRATRTVARGTVSDFRARPELGPPDALAGQALALCGEQAADASSEPRPGGRER